MKKVQKNRFDMRAVPLAVAVAFTPSLWAQAALEEVVVTAQRRAERLQDIPLSITTITGADMEQRGMEGAFAPTVRINAIEPGTILTEALAPYLSAERTDRMLSNTPMGRMGQPEDIAGAAVFLLSPAAAWITGKILGVDGGVEAPNF